MWQALKARDLQRDPRFALHSGCDDPAGLGAATPSWPASSEEITDPERVRAMNGEAATAGPSHLFRLDLREVSTVASTRSARPS